MMVRLAVAPDTLLEDAAMGEDYIVHQQALPWQGTAASLSLVFWQYIMHTYLMLNGCPHQAVLPAPRSCRN